MGFQYAREKARFEREWAKLRREYEAAGMDTNDIQQMYDFDWQFFLSQRIYYIHTQLFPSDKILETADSENSTLFQKFISLSVPLDEEQLPGRYAWVEMINDPRLVKSLRQLNEQDLELLTLFAIERRTQTEIGHMLGYSQSVISRKISRIKKIMKKSRK